MILLLSHRSSVIKPSQPMRAVGREPAEGEIPVELSSYQPLDKIHKYIQTESIYMMHVKLYHVSRLVLNKLSIVK